ncbi:protein crumbs homolog 2 isoform X2 [Ascaphus truei]|uniref:protein crumbs homolog 2 isoform X2 n=1 Tax=Ascaphus truei TaxID=8439 RepID=UPI003F593952
MELKSVNPSWPSTVTLLLLSLCVHEVSPSCVSDPCQHGGTCHETRDGYTCDCHTQPLAYNGPNCGDLYDACAVYPCPSTHVCRSTPGLPEHKCLCQPGFNCSSHACDSDPCATPNSQCTDVSDGFTCQCHAGFTGHACQGRALACSPDPCHNNGTCTAHAGSYTCACEPGYTGQHCEVNIDECVSSPCQNEAICVDKGNRYLCFCVPGFQGYHCEIDINECASKPCLNNGTCVNRMDHYACHCALGYTGVNCETEIDECESNPCQNGATCKDHIGLFSCDCPAGYEGECCQQDIDECQSQPCQNGGHCADAINRYHCDCSDTGFVGETCETDIPECASNPCLNNATCQEGVKSYSCLCWPGYSGVHCTVDEDECAGEPCENAGLCLERSNRSYYGIQPEFDTEFRFSQAAGYVCRCREGLTGERCSVNIDECQSQPCQNGGSCTDLINGFLCHCALGYTGVGCAININDCEHSPCENGASCQDGVAEYFCRCPSAAPDGITWGGKNCSVRLEGCEGHRCQNEAACIPTYEGEIHSYVCKCQPGFYGENCSTPTTFSFPSSGYIVYEMPASNRSRRSAGRDMGSIALRFRTTLPDMVLVCRGDGDTYLLLELYHGVLHAGLRRNGSSAHLAIGEHRVDDGHWHKAEVILGTSLQLILQHEGCSNGSCLKTQILSTEDDPRLPESFSTVYIGGLVEESLLNHTRSRQNFTGCLEDLEIDGRILEPQNIGGDQSFGMELGCNKTEWCHPNPCQHEALCMDRWTSFRCDCIRPYEGPTCLQEYTPGTFHREGTPSFASFTVTQPLGATFDISAFIQTLKADGLLLQISNGTVGYFSAYLQSGRIHIATLSSQTLIFQEDVSDGKKRMINISVREGLVTITHLEKEIELGQLPSVSIAEGDLVHIGGMPPGGSIEAWGGYFKGCLQDVRLNNDRMEFFPLEMEVISMHGVSYPGNSSNVTRGCVSDDTCHLGPCRNDGSCTVTWNDFTCSCPANFTGRTCEEPVWCEHRPCAAETTCRNVPGGYVCLANATFQGQSSVVFAPNISAHRELTSVSLDFRARDREAVLLQASNEVDSLFIAIQDSFLLVTLRSGNGVEGIRFDSTMEVSDASWHRVVIAMEDPSEVSSRWTVQLDNLINMTLQGNAGSLSFLRETVPIILAENYTGCIGQVSIGGIYLPFTDHTFPQQEQFIRSSSGALDLGCRGADVCSKNPCLHGGECEDLFNSLRCVCSAGWEGTHCQLNVNECKSSPCRHGSCTDLDADYRCSCFPGYNGRNCDINVDDCQHHQCLNGGSCVDGLVSYTCTCTASYTGPHCQWPFPPEQCDKNFTCLNSGRCSSGIWGANCSCSPGFTGRRCETNINECQSDPCLNGGTCQDSVNKYKCICNSSFSGVRCEKPRSSREPEASTLVGSAIGTGMLFILLSVITAIMVMMRKKRATQGKYSPSRQEKDGARVEIWNVLKLPPSERLI